MPIGRLFVYNETKGYGFITQENNGKNVFVHASELAKARIPLSASISLAGLMLEYEIGLGNNNKKQALNIKVVGNHKLSGDRLKEAKLEQTTVNFLEENL